MPTVIKNDGVSLTIEDVDDRSTGLFTLIFFTGITTALVGFSLLVLSPPPKNWLGLLLIVVAVFSTSWAFQALPKTKYYVRFKLDEHGIYHRTSPESKELFFSWNRIVEAKLPNPFMSEFSGIDLTILSTTHHPYSHFIAMGEEDSKKAYSMIQQALTK
jgi:hypothetical protein